MKIATYEGHLTESKLIETCRRIFGKVITQYRVDLYKGFVKVDLYIPCIKTLVEFDGYEHYRNARQICRDKNLQEVCKEQKLRLVQIPYWLQLDDSVFQWAFGTEIHEKYIEDKILLRTHFPHGFVSDVCLLPADFSIMGWNRFAIEYESLIYSSWTVMQDVYDSLQEKIQLLGEPRVLGVSKCKLNPVTFMKRNSPKKLLDLIAD